MNHTIKALVLAGLTTLPLTIATTANATNAEEAPLKRVINLQAEASREVANDQMQATLYTELSNSSPTTLAQEINKVLNEASRKAAQYPQVKLSTGAQSTYPIYDDKGKQLKGWRARAQIELKGTDFKATSDLIAALQSNMQVQSIRFSVSDASRKKIENELMVEAAKDFQQRASLMQQSWQASGYELVNLNINAMGDVRPPMIYAAAAMKMANDAVESQNVEAGNTTLRVNANGSIQLR